MKWNRCNISPSIAQRFTTLVQHPCVQAKNVKRDSKRAIFYASRDDNADCGALKCVNFDAKRAAEKADYEAERVDPKRDDLGAKSAITMRMSRLSVSAFVLAVFVRRPALMSSGPPIMPMMASVSALTPGVLSM